MTSKNPGPYKLSLTSAATNDLRRLVVAAKLMGRGAETIEAARRIEERLLHDPMEAGEPLYDLGPPPIAVRVIPVRPLAAEYGVMEIQRAMCVRRFRSMLDPGP
jgi:hypothetical protein